MRMVTKVGTEAWEVSAEWGWEVRLVLSMLQRAVHDVLGQRGPLSIEDRVEAARFFLDGRYAHWVGLLNAGWGLELPMRPTAEVEQALEKLRPLVSLNGVKNGCN